MLKYRAHKRGMSPTERKRQLLQIKSVKHHPPLPFLLVFCCLSALHLSSGFPQSAAHYVDELDIPESERLAFCFSQWTALSDQPQISNFVMDLCSSIINRMKVNAVRTMVPILLVRITKKYTKEAQDPALKTGESHITTEEFTKKDSSGSMARPFFLFRPRNGRKVSIEEQ
ncbi:neuromedin-S isoform X1 [Hyla sarda]|uniref:neuromedin-S isoform X1 n=1 Tax=Hyla sarda TaxID=327740 RepID=UPI0024C3D25B|nr:neuromedin-S isoform X1 [Hyla sarda]